MVNITQIQRFVVILVVPIWIDENIFPWLVLVFCTQAHLNVITDQNPSDCASLISAGKCGNAPKYWEYTLFFSSTDNSSGK